MNCFDGDKILDASGELNYTEDLTDIPSEYKGVNACIDLRNVVFEKSGEYMLNLLIDDEELYCKKVFVKGKNELNGKQYNIFKYK